MAANYSRAPASGLRDVEGPSTMQQTKPQRTKPADIGHSSPVDTSTDVRPPPSGPDSSATSAAARPHSPDSVAAAGTSSNAVAEDDGDVKSESAYQREMWARIQRSQREIQQMRTPMIDGFVPARGFHELRRTTNPVNGTDKSGRSFNDLASHYHHGAPPPANYVDLNRRQLHQRGSNNGRWVALYPSKSYSEMFAKKKENETSYT